MAARAITKTIQLILNGKAAGSDAFRAAIVQQRAVGNRIKVRVTRKEGTPGGLRRKQAAQIC